MGWLTGRRRGIVIVAALGLGGCNMAVSPMPLIVHGQPAAQLLAPGRWVSFGSDCRRRARTWPSCAERFAVRQGRIIGAPRTTRPISVQIARGARLGLAQIELGDSAPRAEPFGYVGVEIEARARNGLISRFNAWPVLCRLTPAERGGKPLPGLTPHADDTNCGGRSLRAIAAAAVRSKAEAPKTEFRRIGANGA